ncbi:GMP/IMP nucleotidase [Shewanella sp. WXL01]|uniref:GMP/IMP nucleotidase n=1 Tax=Shewanella maritima TaxID=2520507 RepID=A0A411PH29_9GAMM|nr:MULTISPECIES: GMP/IMP nucleotidase [Shewanella]NKF52494.1 GMP/IMP nucleotidase [Shewanella sp. WXL01]QBF82906.1 GMP/IMP nucleotidase [Shewanella maritima]
MFPWQKIDAVLLDMDGTLLDLHFDNYFWLHLVPEQLSLQRNINLEQSHQLVKHAYNQVAGTLNWYCLDYWQQQLELDIIALHHQAKDKIAMRDDTMPLLNALANAGKKRILFTNAHPKSLALKLEYTDLAGGLDAMLSSHESGFAKEHPEFWRYGFNKFDLDPSRCLFIDDSETILKASKLAGVGYQLGVTNPDSTKAPHSFEYFKQIDDYQQLVNSLANA